MGIENNNSIEFLGKQFDKTTLKAADLSVAALGLLLTGLFIATESRADASEIPSDRAIDFFLEPIDT